MIMNRPLPVLFVLLLLALPASPSVASEVFVFMSMKDGELWSQVEPGLQGSEVIRYSVDLLAVADYSARQKAVARSSGSRLALVAGPRAGEILEGASFRVPVLAVQVAGDLEAPGHVVVHLHLGEGGELSQRIASLEEIAQVPLEGRLRLELAPGLGLAPAVRALVERL